MKKTLLYIALMLLGAAGFTACDDNWETPPMYYPQVSQEVLESVNTSIADLKTKYYSSESKSYQVVGQTVDGEDIVIRGRIVSSTEAGNVYKAFYVQDETGAIQVRINNSKVYQIFQMGQEVIINCSGLGIGNYGGLLQLGGEVNNGTPGYIDDEVYSEKIHAFGMAQPSKIETADVTVAQLKSILKSSDETLLWQCRRVRVTDVKIEGGGYLPYADTESTYNTSRYFGNEDGKIIMYNSPYATFCDQIMPSGTGSVTGVLSYYNGNWQIIINDTKDLEGFDPVVNPEDVPTYSPEGEGTLASPYNVAMALQVIKSGQASTEKVYIKGKVSLIDNVDTSYGNATYYISDSGYMIKQLEVFRGYSLGGDKFASADEIKVGDELVIYGVLVDYNGTPEVTSGSSIVSINGNTGKPDVPDTPPTGSASFRVASTIVSGHSYILVSDNGKVATPVNKDYSYGRLGGVEPESSKDGVIVTSADNAITFTSTAEGYTMTDCYGRYLAMDDNESHKTFQLYTEAREGVYWTVTFSATGVEITNTLRNMWVSWAASYGNFSPASDGTKPVLYEKID